MSTEVKLVKLQSQLLSANELKVEKDVKAKLKACLKECGEVVFAIVVVLLMLLWFGLCCVLLLSCC